MGNRSSKKTKYKQIKFKPEPIDLECRLYFQEPSSGRYENSKVFFRRIEPAERYTFQESEFAEVYINNMLAFSGTDSTLEAFNSIITELPECDFQYKVIEITDKDSNEISFTIKEDHLNNYFVLFGKNSVFFATTQLRTVNELLKKSIENSSYIFRAISNDGLTKELETLMEALEYFQLKRN